MRTNDGVMLKEEKEMHQCWVEHFQELLNVETDGEVEVVAVGRERMCKVEELPDEIITVGEVQKALKKTKSWESSRDG